MPKNITYSPVFDLVSMPRINSFSSLFGVYTQAEVYGVYIWSQHASASIYPLMQQLEIILRNSIDKVSRERFGDFWWNSIEVNSEFDNHKHFIDKIKKAERELKGKWARREKERLGLGKSDSLPPGLIFEPSHDDVVATSDLYTWQAVLVDAHVARSGDDPDKFLWPKSMPKVFRKYSDFNSSPHDARSSILNAINEIRDYRNRLFHHDCIWIKSGSTDKRSAIDTIRKKINLIEKVIGAISPSSKRALNKWGLFEHAKRVCSVKELDIYTDFQEGSDLSEEDESLFFRYYEMTNYGKETVSIKTNNGTLALYKMREN